MASAISIAIPSKIPFYSYFNSSLSSLCFSLTSPSPCVLSSIDDKLKVSSSSYINPRGKNGRNSNFICRAAEYKFPDPIPEFAETETEKFKSHLLKKLPKKKELFEDSVDEIVGICTEIFTTFLHSEYGGPGTLLVEPFIDMADTINERGLPGGPQAARAAIKWAQNHVDNDWKEWTGNSKN